MKPIKFLPFAAALLISFTGCETTSSISKSSTGNLELTIYPLSSKSKDTLDARIYVDGDFVGNPTNTKPVLELKKGWREIRVTNEGYESYSQEIKILGSPNHQALNITLKPEDK